MMCSNPEWGFWHRPMRHTLAGAYGGAGKRGFTGFRWLTRSQQYFYRESLLFQCVLEKSACRSAFGVRERRRICWRDWSSLRSTAANEVFEGHEYGLQRRVLNRHRIVEDHHHAVARVAFECAAVFDDLLADGGVVFAKQGYHVFCVGAFGE